MCSLVGSGLTSLSCSDKGISKLSVGEVSDVVDLEILDSVDLGLDSGSVLLEAHLLLHAGAGVGGVNDEALLAQGAAVVALAFVIIQGVAAVGRVNSCNELLDSVASFASRLNNDIAAFNLEDGPAEVLSFNCGVGVDDSLGDCGHDFFFS